jgi:hypothetical protein
MANDAGRMMVEVPTNKGEYGPAADELQALEQTCMSTAKRLDSQRWHLDSPISERRAFLDKLPHDLRTPLPA